MSRFPESRYDYKRRMTTRFALAVCGAALLAFVAIAVASSGAKAQNNFPTAGGSRVDGAVIMCLDAGGLAVPGTAAGTCLGAGGGGGGGLSVVDAASWTTGVSAFTPTGGVFNDSAAALTSGQQGTLRLTNNRAAHVNVRNAAGTEMGTASNPFVVSGVGIANPSTTSGQTMSLVGGASTTAALACTNLNSCALNLTPLGGVRFDSASWAGTALGSPSNFGTSPGAVAVPGVNASLYVGTTVADGNSGNKSAGTQRVVLATDQPSLTNALSVINGATSAVNTVAASQSAQVLSNTSGGGTGATGDYLSHCVVIPTSTSPGVVSIIDNATTVFPFPGGASSISNLVPFTIPVGSKSVSGAWKVTTGANVSVSCVGKFS